MLLDVAIQCLSRQVQGNIPGDRYKRFIAAPAGIVVARVFQVARAHHRLGYPRTGIEGVGQGLADISRLGINGIVVNPQNRLAVRLDQVVTPMGAGGYQL